MNYTHMRIQNTHGQAISRASNLHNFLQQHSHGHGETSGESISWHLRSNGARGVLAEALPTPSYLTAQEPFGRTVPTRRGSCGAQAPGEHICREGAASLVRAPLVMTQ